MYDLTTQLRALSLLLALVLFVAVYDRVDTAVVEGRADNHLAAVWDPVANFLGIGSGVPNTAPQYESLQTQTQGTQSNTFLSLRNFGSPAGGSSYQPLTNRTPVLLCVPDEVGAGEEVIVMWACRDGAHTTEGDNIDTEGAVFGALRVTPTEETEYTVTCINDIPDADNTSTSCTVEIPEVAVTFEASATRVDEGETVTFSWTTDEVRSCVLVSSRHPTYRRTGAGGEVVSPPIERDTTFTLTCEAVTGALIEREIEVTAR